MNSSERKKTPAADKKKQETSNSEGPNRVHVDMDHDVYLPYLDEIVIANLEMCHVVFTGKIRINPKNPRDAYLPAPDGGPDILVQGIWERNRSLDGDEVYAIVQPTLGNMRTSLRAVVVGIKTRVHNRVVVGTLTASKGQNYGLLRPTDSRLPFIRIPFNNLPKERTNLLFATIIAQWTNVKYATSYSVESLGEAGTIAGETNSILMRLEISINPYPQSCLKFFPPANYKPSADEIKQRMDCRKMCIFTIDPATAKDLDDAVSCEIRKNGTLRIGVHIADVAHFFSEGTDFDKAVANRATTVYLVDKVFHMLPKPLCELCSLLPGKDKLTFSVFWEMDSDHNVIDTYFKKTVINSCAQLSYSHAQQLIDGADVDLPKIHNGFTADDIKTSVLVLNETARKLRKARFDKGALHIAQVKIGFVMDTTSNTPMDYFQEVQLEANKLIEEFMLLANISVARKIEESFPDIAFLRQHSPPKDEYIRRFQTLLERYGIMIDPTSSKTIQDSLNKFSSGLPDEKIRSIVINHFLAKTMTRANYFCSSYATKPVERAHYALCVDSYTHFTSPIRRYADIMVHRLLASSLKLREPPRWSPEYVMQVAEECNSKKYAAKLAGEASIQLFFSVYVSQQGSFIAEAVVFNIGNGCIEAIVTTSGTVVRIHFSNIAGKVKVENDESSNEATINWTRGRQQKICIFSRIMVEITRGKGIELDATLLPITVDESYLETNGA